MAVKEIIIPDTDPTETAYVVEDFKNEVEVCMLLDHRNLVKTLGFTTRRRLTVIQEFVENGHVVACAISVSRRDDAATEPLSA